MTGLGIAVVVGLGALSTFLGARLVQERQKSKHRQTQALQTQEALQAKVDQLLEQTTHLLARDAEWQAFLDHVPAEVVLNDIEGRYTLVNRYWEQLNGLTNDEAKGKRAIDVFGATAESLERETSEVAKTLMGGLAEVTQHSPEGDRTFLSSCFPIHNPDGQLAAIGGFAFDITARKVAQEALRQLNQDLEERVQTRTRELQTAQERAIAHERLATVGQMAATFGHELRNPLSTIAQSLYIVRKTVTVTDPRTKRSLDRLDRNVERCLRLIEDTLDFARLGQREPTVIELQPWLATVLDELEEPSEFRAQRTFETPGVLVLADGERLRRAIINVWNNARQALSTPVEGEPAPASAEPSLKVITCADDTTVAIVFTDSGPGMDKEVQRRMFEPLFSTRGFGTGLGLPTVKQIMEAHGGGVDVASSRGEGTSVRLWMRPFRQDPTHATKDGVQYHNAPEDQEIGETT